MNGLRLEAYGSGDAPDMRVMASAYREWLESAKENPDEEAAYQLWLKDYMEKKNR